MALSYENVSPIFILGHSAPLILHNNTFSENIGTTGGGINIISPNFELNRNWTTLNVTKHMNNSLPLIYMNENNFTKNMAYFSGNAFSIINTRRMMTNYFDYMQFCGAGI